MAVSIKNKLNWREHILSSFFVVIVSTSLLVAGPNESESQNLDPKKLEQSSLQYETWILKGGAFAFWGAGCFAIHKAAKHLDREIGYRIAGPIKEVMEGQASAGDRFLKITFEEGSQRTARLRSVMLKDFSDAATLRTNFWKKLSAGFMAMGTVLFVGSMLLDDLCGTAEGAELQHTDFLDLSKFSDSRIFQALTHPRDDQSLFTALSDLGNWLSWNGLEALYELKSNEYEAHITAAIEYKHFGDWFFGSTLWEILKRIKNRPEEIKSQLSILITKNGIQLIVKDLKKTWPQLSKKEQEQLTMDMYLFLDQSMQFIFTELSRDGIIHMPSFY